MDPADHSLGQRRSVACDTLRAAVLREGLFVAESPSPRASRAWVRASDVPLRIFGLAPSEHGRRALRLAGVTRVAVTHAPPPREDDRGSAVALRGDFLIDPRLVQGLCAEPGVALRDPTSGALVAAHVRASELAACAAWLDAPDGATSPPGLRCVVPTELASSYAPGLRSAKPPYLHDLRSRDPREAPRIEAALFADAYKGVTDVVTRYVWPRPALFVVRRCAAAGIHPNVVTAWSYLLVVVAALLFARGHFGAGLAAAFTMTFLDTVDGKLARVTLRSTRLGGVLDHGLDLVHPPFWWWAWGVGVGLAQPEIALATWICVVGYVVGRAIEGAFLALFALEIHSWRPVDSRFRGVTARRNPNLVLLAAGTLAGRPDAGLVAVALWTVACIAFHLARLALALRERRAGRIVAPWYTAASPARVLLLGLALLAVPATALAAEPARDPLQASRARLGESELAMEQWDLTARLDSGHVVLLQVLVTNLGVGDRNVAVTGHVVGPDGALLQYRTGKREGDWSLSPDGLRVKVGKTTFDQSASPPRLRVQRKKLKLDLAFPRGLAGGRSAAPARGALARDGYVLDLVQAEAPVEGALWTEGMAEPLAVRGTAALTHRSMDDLESRLVQRRLELVAWSGDVALYLLDVLRPNGGTERWLVVRRGAETLVESASVEVDWRGAPARADGFGVPREVRFRAAGTTGRARFERELLRYEPLGDIPTPIRILVSMATQPRRTWSDAAVELTLGSGAVPLRGVGDVTFLNPVPEHALPAAADTGG
jgi:phosphatidylglycerophosphate synthase